jgi:hypothetical protein
VSRVWTMGSPRPSKKLGVDLGSWMPPLRDGLLQTWATILIQLSQKELARSLLDVSFEGDIFLMSSGTPRIRTMAPSFFSDCRLPIFFSGHAILNRASSKLTAFLVVFHAPRCQILGTNHRISSSVVDGNPRQTPPSFLTTFTPLSNVKALLPAARQSRRIDGMFQF